MEIRQPRYSTAEFRRRGTEIYESAILPTLQKSDRGKFVAIDIETGAFEMDDDEMTACDRLLEKQSAAQTWMVRVGYRTTRHFGGRSIKENP